MRLINQTPGRGARILLGALPFVLLLSVYVVFSALRRAENPADKVLPSLGAMAEAFWRLATEADQRSGDYLLWTDTAASLIRLGSGMGIATLLALSLGILIGFIPRVRATLAPLLAALSLIPPITVLPILFIAVSSDTLPVSKVNEYADTMLAQRISTLPGVAQVLIYGSQKYAVRVQADPGKLAAQDLSFIDLQTALGAAALFTPLPLWILRLWPHRDPGVCHQCGYSLAGLPDEAPCPECGTPHSDPDSA